MTSARHLIENIINDDQSMAADFELLGIPINNGTPLFTGADRLTIGFMNMQDRSQFVQDAEAKGFHIDEIDAAAYPAMIPDTYPFLAIVWK